MSVTFFAPEAIYHEALEVNLTASNAATVLAAVGIEEDWEALGTVAGEMPGAEFLERVQDAVLAGATTDYVRERLSWLHQLAKVADSQACLIAWG